MPFIVKIIVKICLDESHETKKKIDRNDIYSKLTHGVKIMVENGLHFQLKNNTFSALT